MPSDAICRSRVAVSRVDAASPSRRVVPTPPRQSSADVSAAVNPARGARAPLISAPASKAVARWPPRSAGNAVVALHAAGVGQNSDQRRRCHSAAGPSEVRQSASSVPPVPPPRRAGRRDGRLKRPLRRQRVRRIGAASRSPVTLGDGQVLSRRVRRVAAPAVDAQRDTSAQPLAAVRRRRSRQVAPGLRDARDGSGAARRCSGRTRPYWKLQTRRGAAACCRAPGKLGVTPRSRRGARAGVEPRGPRAAPTTAAVAQRARGSSALRGRGTRSVRRQDSSASASAGRSVAASRCLVRQHGAADGRAHGEELRSGRSPRARPAASARQGSRGADDAPIPERLDAETVRHGGSYSGGNRRRSRTAARAGMATNAIELRLPEHRHASRLARAPRATITPLQAQTAQTANAHVAPATPRLLKKSDLCIGRSPQWTSAGAQNGNGRQRRRPKRSTRPSWSSGSTSSAGSPRVAPAASHRVLSAPRTCRRRRHR